MPKKIWRKVYRITVADLMYPMECRLDDDGVR